MCQPEPNSSGFCFRHRRLRNVKFRPHPIGPCIVDFYCAASRLVVEIDGDIHDLQPEHDASRAACLQQGGYELIRLRNEQVLNHTDRVLDGIAAACFRTCRSDNAHLSPAAESGKGQ